ncbi:MAG: ABC transporter substrate-binding protein [Coriobacteriales bacterium]|jgi:iron complex transport system substrate-binding protein|nr:ABC transporter substrate-binding protein [Coriobacteriales bacterium]
MTEKHHSTTTGCETTRPASLHNESANAASPATPAAPATSISATSPGALAPNRLSRRDFLRLGGTAGFALLALSGSSLLAACAGSPQPQSGSSVSSQSSSSVQPSAAASRSVTNLDGTSITIPQTVTAVAAIFGPSYERIVAVGAEDRIICDGDFHISGWPWSNVIYKRVNDVPGIPNAHSDLNVEDLVARDVQLVFCFPNPQQAEAISNAGMSAVPMAGTGKFRDIVDSLNLYAEIFNDATATAQAQAYARYFDDTLAMVKQRTEGVTERPRVYLAYTDMLHGYGAKSDMIEVINLAGGVLVSTELEGGSNIAVTPEQLIQWNPDYIFIDHAGSSGNATAEDAIKEALATGDYNNITAVKSNQVLATPTGVFFWDSGIQKILYLVYIAKTIHPSLFADVDLTAMLKEFYEQFFFYQLSDSEAAQILNHQNPA